MIIGIATILGHILTRRGVDDLHLIACIGRDGHRRRVKTIRRTIFYRHAQCGAYRYVLAQECAIIKNSDRHSVRESDTHICRQQFHRIVINVYASYYCSQLPNLFCRSSYTDTYFVRGDVNGQPVSPFVIATYIISVISFARIVYAVLC